MAENLPPLEGLEVQYEDLESLAEADFVDFVVTLDEGVAEVGDGSAFVDSRFELEHPNTLQYTYLLANIVAAKPDDDGARMASYRAFHFAHTISAMLLSAPTGMVIGDFFQSEEPEVIRGKLIHAVSDYFSARPALDSLTARYMHELDPSGRYGEVAELVAGSTFLLIEEYMYQQALNEAYEEAIDREVADFRTQLEAL